MTESPKDLGYRMPAEWEKQKAIWLTYPTNKTLWPGYFNEYLEQYCNFIATISHFENVCINYAFPDDALTHLKKTHANLKNIHFFKHPANDVWCRDHGPIFIKNDATNETAITDWQFHGWGGKFEANLDNQIPSLVAKALNKKIFSYPFELEGGAIDVSGDGLLLTTECVQNNPNRAKGRDDTAFKNSIKSALNINEILWLPNGLANDDTDGHIDNLARFITPRAIISVSETNKEHCNFIPLQKNLSVLKNFKTPENGTFDIIELPMPESFALAGRQLPPSYANFLILNDAVILPVYGQKRDATAIGILKDCFPNREIIPLRSEYILIEGGSFHCLSQQEPA